MAVHGHLMSRFDLLWRKVEALDGSAFTQRHKILAIGELPGDLVRLSPVGHVNEQRLRPCRQFVKVAGADAVQLVAIRRCFSPCGLPVLAVVTKSDKLSRAKINRKVEEIQSRLGVAAIAFSALTGVGKKELLSSIRSLVAEYFENTRK